MMIDKKRAAAEASALQTTLVLAARMDWRLGRGPLPTTSFAQFLYIETAQLLLVPTSAGLPFAMRQIEPVVRDTRSDALIVSQSTSGPPVLAFAAWARRATAWMHPLELWVGLEGEMWLAPVNEADSLGFRLLNRLHHASAVPWISEAERQAGRCRALSWLAEGGRGGSCGNNDGAGTR